jgi:hypothetical protein
MLADFARASAAAVISTRSRGVAAGLAAFDLADVDLGGRARGFVITPAPGVLVLGIDFFAIAPV